ncbi:hypothetical protein BOH66_13840 [Microbacterium aurum]|uniref:BioF2-like acetyltransferase domain-containing protein n=1 Tax=Microbacterium aurum TaxID=36805 RepID=A0A1P8UAV3_9MICO|nr:GNAT family N-acetyltransferase [Microbacterium aurum]APZ35206.1 hypothetical protein BOH66_13840 [Microbacterium aurum]MBM7829183.1 CelD/BcsL family acetyltransferase involved in cellulose biosynthesis [Microbacterium aurum]
MSPDEAGATRARTLALRDVTEVDRERWQNLSRRALEPNPFLDPRYLLTAHRMLDGLDDIRLVIVEDGDEWIAVTPLSALGRFAKTPLRYASTAGAYLGRRASLCVPLIDAASPQRAIAATLAHLSSRASRLPGLVELTLLPADGPVSATLRSECARVGVPVQERSRFARAFADATSPVHAPEHLSSARRKRLRRLRSGLEREVGPLEFTDHGSDMAALETLLDLEAAGWKGERRTAQRKKPAELAWFLDFIAQFGASGDFRVLTLRSAEYVIFTSLVLVIDGHAFGTMDAYDERFAAFSPGVLGRVLEQQRLMADATITTFDPCMHPRYVDATALYPDRREMVSVLLAAHGASRVLLRARPWAQRMRARFAGIRRGAR